MKYTDTNAIRILGVVLMMLAAGYLVGGGGFALVLGWALVAVKIEP